MGPDVDTVPEQDDDESVTFMLVKMTVDLWNDSQKGLPTWSTK